jgi:sortase A
MKVTMPVRPLRRILRWSEFALFTCAAATLGYSAYAVIDTQMYQALRSREFGEALDLRRSLVRPPDIPPAFVMSGLVGRIEIERLGLSVMIAEGTDGTTLRRAAGHVPGTALPGESGNIGITGHRDTFFHPLRNIQVDDKITLTTLWGEYHYRVVLADIVSPQDVEVLDPTGGETLTLVTCYPFYYVGAAPDRFVVRAERVKG